MNMVRLLRCKMGLSQREMGSLLGVPTWRIGRIERGRSIKPEELSALIREFGDLLFLGLTHEQELKHQTRDSHDEGSNLC